jgi:hypothetical protein
MAARPGRPRGPANSRPRPVGLARSNSWIRSRSALVAPARSPLSFSAGRTQRCRVFAVPPILAAIEPIATPCDSCSPWCSRTLRTARSLTSGERLVDVFMAPSSQMLEPPRKPGRFSDDGHAFPTGRAIASSSDPPAVEWSRYSGLVEPISYHGAIRPSGRSFARWKSVIGNAKRLSILPIINNKLTNSDMCSDKVELCNL